MSNLATAIDERAVLLQVSCLQRLLVLMLMLKLLLKVSMMELLLLLELLALVHPVLSKRKHGLVIDWMVDLEVLLGCEGLSQQTRA